MMMLSAWKEVNLLDENMHNISSWMLTLLLLVVHHCFTIGCTYNSSAF